MVKKMEYANWTEEQKIAHVTDALSREGLSPEVETDIRDWLLRGESAGRQDNVLEEILNRMFREHRTPTQQTYDSLFLLHERLGLPVPDSVDNKTVSMKRNLLQVAATVLPLAVMSGTVRVSLRADHDSDFDSDDLFIERVLRDNDLPHPTR